MATMFEMSSISGLPSEAGSAGKIDNPFLMDSSSYMPRDIRTAYDMALFLAFLNPRFVKAIQTKFAFFITDIDVTPKDLSSDESVEYKQFLLNEIGLFSLMAEVAASYSVYGNAFIVPYIPFTRYLTIGSRKFDLQYLQRHVNDLQFKSDEKNLWYEFKADGKSYKAGFTDMKADAGDKVRFRIIDPRQIHLLHNMVSCTTRYVYDFEQSVRQQAKKEGQDSLHIVNELPKEMLRAILCDKDFMFAQDYIYHFKMNSIPGVVENGLGIPPSIEHFRQIFNLQVYRKIDEAIGMDYMLPFRLFSPASGTNLQDVLQHHNLGSWRQAIKTVIDTRRRDKMAIHSMPFPVTYQEFGAQGKSLTPKDLIEYGQNELLNSIGYPVELFNGSLTWQAMPMALRLFESTNMSIYFEYSKFVTWVTKTVSRVAGQDPVNAILKKPTLADSIERRQALVQLMQIGEVSRRTGMATLGITDPVAEGTTRLDEDIQLEKERARKQEEAQREMQAGIFDTGGGEGSQGGMNPQDRAQQAIQMAEEWLAMPTDGMRSQAMQQVKAQDEQLYSLAKQKMEEIRRAGESQGRAQTAASYQQGGVQ